MVASYENQLKEMMPEIEAYERREKESRSNQDAMFEHQSKLLGEWIRSDKYKAMKTWYSIKGLITFLEIFFFVLPTMYTFGLIWVAIVYFRSKYWRWPFAPLFCMLFRIKPYMQCKPQMTDKGAIISA